MAKKGIDVLLKVNTGTDVAPVYTVVGFQRGATFSEEVDTLESTHKQSGNYKTFEYSFGTWTIEGEGLQVPSEAGYTALKDAISQHKKLKAQWVEADGNTYEGTVLVTSLELDAPYDDLMTYSFSLQGDGAYTTSATP